MPVGASATKHLFTVKLKKRRKRRYEPKNNQARQQDENDACREALTKEQP